MRAMELEFENDRNALPLDTQYMLGESLLVSPVLFILYTDRLVAGTFLVLFSNTISFYKF